MAGFAYVDRGIIEGIRVAFGSVGPTPLLARHVMADLVGRPADPSVAALAVAALAKDIAPIDDLRSTRGYRMRVAENLVTAFVRGLVPS